MPSNHILEIGEAPTVNPSGNAGDDYIHTQASPDAFGASVGKAEEGLGQAITNAGTTALDIQTQRQNQQNELHASDVNTWLSGRITDRFSTFSHLEGQAPTNALPQLKSDLHDLYQQAIAQAGNDNTKVMIAKAGASQVDQFQKYATMHADQQFKVWQDQSDTLHAANQGAQSTTAAVYGDLQHSDALLAASGAVIANNARAKGYDEAAIDTMVKANTGSHVMNTVQQLALVGKDGQPDIPGAQAYFDRYKDHMDPSSVLHTEEWLKSRTNDYDGRQLATRKIAEADGAHRYTDPGLPAFAAAAQANPGAMSPAGMARAVQIESRGDPSAIGKAGHVGLVQASQDYWNRFGEGSRMDPNESIAALGRSTAADSKVLTRVLGRQPSDGELYLAHQQGAGGASALLRNPDERAGNALYSSGAYKTVEKADAAIRANGGNPDGPARAFANMWIGKFSGPGGSVTPGGGQTFQLAASVAGTYRAPYSRAVPDPLAPIVNPALAVGQPQDQAAPSLPTIAPAQAQGAGGVFAPAEQQDESMSPASRKAAAFAGVLNDPSASEEVKQIALRHVSQLLQAQSIAEEADAHARAELSEKTAGGYFERIENGETKDLAPQIINDRRMKYETRHALLNLLEGATGDRNVKNYGTGYADAYRRIMLPENDPNRIVDPLDLYRQGAPGGTLTPSGVGKLAGVLNAVRKSTDDAAVNRVKSSMLTYANEQMTYTIPSLFPGQPDKRDVKGTELFNSEFVPRLEAAYDAYIKAGHNPWDANSPLQKKNVDALIEQIRPQRQKAQDQISDPRGEHNQASSTQPMQGDRAESDGLLPPPPRNVDWNGWIKVVSRPPTYVGGQPMSHTFWATQVNKLLANPTPQIVGFFNAKFGKAGFDGDEVLSMLGRQRTHASLPVETLASHPAPSAPADTTGEMLGP